MKLICTWVYYLIFMYIMQVFSDLLFHDAYKDCISGELEEKILFAFREKSMTTNYCSISVLISRPVFSLYKYI